MNDRQQLSHFRSFLHNAVQSGIGSQPERKQLFEKALADSLNPTAESFEKLPKVLKMILTERKCVPTEISDKALLDFVTEVVSCALNEYDTLRENCILSFEYRVSKMFEFMGGRRCCTCGYIAKCIKRYAQARIEWL